MTKKILLLPGDGIGPEIMKEAVKVIDTLKQSFGFSCEVEHALIGGEAIDQKQDPLPKETLDLASSADSILMGAVGGPKWDNLLPDKRPEKGLLRIRKAFDLFANLRPALLYPQLAQASTLKYEVVSNLNMMIVRELTGGIYFGEPRGINLKDGEHAAFNTMIYHEHEITRITKVACEIANKRQKRICSVDKANVLEVSQLWRQTTEDYVKTNYPEISLSHMYVDNAAMQLVRNPKQFDVIVTGNLFGDILSDCAAMLTGSIGMLPSASLNDKQFGLYEPVHGSAPDIAGFNKANPLALLLSLSMMLRYSLESHELADLLDKAIDDVLTEGYRTKDIATLQENAVSCSTMGDAVQAALQKLS